MVLDLSLWFHAENKVWGSSLVLHRSVKLSKRSAPLLSTTSPIRQLLKISPPASVRGLAKPQINVLNRVPQPVSAAPNPGVRPNSLGGRWNTHELTSGGNSAVLGGPRTPSPDTVSKRMMLSCFQSALRTDSKKPHACVSSYLCWGAQQHPGCWTMAVSKHPKWNRLYQALIYRYLKVCIIWFFPWTLFCILL